ncbi:FAD-dependent oxidoreductase [Deinococcus malanensis]|uniref:FAD-dependent oxidoreductase n=1 Tax=Deinococcus malanensis TaxID=1706855 RepID=UPI00362BC72A
MSVIVVGGGLIGSAVAFTLRDAGLEVEVLDADLPGAAWRAAAGLLTPHGERLHGTPLHADALESLSLWPDFARSLEAYGGQSVHFRPGVLHIGRGQGGQESEPAHQSVPEEGSSIRPAWCAPRWRG